MIFVHNPYYPGCVDHIAWHHIDHRNNFIKFGQLILRKIIKIVATRYQILRPKCPNLFQLGLSPRPRWGSLQHSHRSPSWWRQDLLLPCEESHLLALNPLVLELWPCGPQLRRSHAFFFPNLGMSECALMVGCQEDSTLAFFRGRSLGTA